MSTITLIWIAAVVTVAMWSAIEFYAWWTGRRLITWHLRKTPRMIVFIMGMVIGALAGHFWWCP